MSLELPPFEEFTKIARLSRDIVVTEKMDGGNACVYIHETDDQIYAASRSTWLTLEDDFHGFAKWVKKNEAELRAGLGFGRHYGEWWGAGIGKRFKNFKPGVKTFSLFNTGRWKAQRELHARELPPIETAAFAPACCDVVPVLYRGAFSTAAVDLVLDELVLNGSVAAPGTVAEGLVVYHVAANVYFKKTFDDRPKGSVESPGSTRSRNA